MQDSSPDTPAQAATAIEIVFGQVSPELAQEAASFWLREQALSGRQQALARAAHLLAVARDAHGQLIGVTTAVSVTVPWLLNNRFFLLRGFVGHAQRRQGVMTQLADQGLRYLNERAREHPQDPHIGVYLDIHSPLIQAAWTQGKKRLGGLELVYAGRDSQGRHRRIGYFDGVRITADNAHRPVPAQAPQRTLRQGYQLTCVWQQMTPALIEELVAFWQAESAMPTAKAEARAGQAVYLARDSAGNIAGVCTAEKATVDFLHNRFYLFRAFVAEQARQGELAAVMTVQSRDFFQQRYQQGDDSAIGLFMDVESPILKKYRNEAVWLSSQMVFCGTNNKGDHCRVFYFENAPVTG